MLKRVRLGFAPTCLCRVVANLDIDTCHDFSRAFMQCHAYNYPKPQVCSSHCGNATSSGRNAIVKTYRKVSKSEALIFPTSAPDAIWPRILFTRISCTSDYPDTCPSRNETRLGDCCATLFALDSRSSMYRVQLLGFPQQVQHHWHLLGPVPQPSLPKCQNGDRPSNSSM